MLELGFVKTWQQPTIRQQLGGPIQNYIREVVLYREALAMDLNRDDPVVRQRQRQRLRQKPGFLFASLVALQGVIFTGIMLALVINTASISL